MVSFGSYPREEEDPETAIPFEDTIAGEVVRSRRSYFVPNNPQEEKYRNKEKVRKYGIHSMLAVPISLPRFFLERPGYGGSPAGLLQKSRIES